MCQRCSNVYIDLGFYFLFLQESTENPNPLAKAELNLLAHLMGGNDEPSNGRKFYR
jgi:hypothetical protein